MVLVKKINPVILLSLLLIVLSTAGWLSMHIDRDLLAIFPQNNNKVEAMARIKKDFEKGGRLLVLISAENSDQDLNQYAANLEDQLKDSGLTSSILFEPIWEKDKKSLTELLAYLWINAPPEQFSAQFELMKPSRIKETLALAQENLSITFDPVKLSILARDPLGFMTPPSVDTTTSANPFQSIEKDRQLLIIYPHEQAESAGSWCQKIESILKQWQSQHQHLRVHYTGGPAFASEIARTIRRDVIIAVLVSSLFSGLIFWILTKNNRLIYLQMSFVLVILMATFGLGSLILGPVSLMSMGFASILVGLAVDYGMIICFQAQRKSYSARELFDAVLKPILYASISTAAVFFALCISDIPGIRELGLFVGIGILMAAFVLLNFFTPLAAKINPNLGSATAEHKFPAPLKGRWIVVTGLTLFILFVGAHGIPKVTFDIHVMTPSSSPAKASLEIIKHAFPHRFRTHNEQLILQSSDLTKLRADLLECEKYAQGLLPISAMLPAENHQAINKNTAREVIQNSEQIHLALIQMGYKDEALNFNRQFIATLAKFVQQSSTSYIEAPELLNWFKPTIQYSPTGLSQVLVDVPASRQHPQATSWSAVENSISQQIIEDLGRILIAVIALIGFLLFLALKDFKLCLIGMVSLGSPIALIVLGVQYSPIEWNFLNIFAIPLLLGMGVDYVVHITFATLSSDRSSAKGIQRTLLACGSTSVVGFFSLCLSSNQAFASLGILCGLGVILTMTFCLILLPKLLFSRSLD